MDSGPAAQAHLSATPCKCSLGADLPGHLNTTQLCRSCGHIPADPPGMPKRVLRNVLVRSLGPG